MRPIDADALKAKFCNHCDERDCKPDATDTVYGCVIADTIDSMPTIEAELVKHGRWIETKTERGWNCAEYPVEWTCSECNVANDRKDDFCPHCGSYNRMGGDSE